MCSRRNGKHGKSRTSLAKCTTRPQSRLWLTTTTDGSCRAEPWKPRLLQEAWKLWTRLLERISSLLCPTSRETLDLESWCVSLKLSCILALSFITEAKPITTWKARKSSAWWFAQHDLCIVCQERISVTENFGGPNKTASCLVKGSPFRCCYLEQARAVHGDLFVEAWV